MRRRKIPKENWAVGFLLLFVLHAIRYIYYGFTYFPQLDDYIQYHNYAAFNDGFFDIMQKTGLLASRPLAGVLDQLLWSPLFSVMIVAVLLMAAMYAASGCLFRSVLQKYFPVGPIFLVVYGLLPLGFEGTYWVSASSRIVVGLFFAALSLWFFQRFLLGGKGWNLLPYFLFQFLCFGLYEQVIVFSITATFLLALWHFPKDHKRPFAALLTFVNAGLLVLLLGLFRQEGSAYSSRMVTAFPWEEGYVSYLLLPVLKQMWQVLAEANLMTLGKGFLRGLSIQWQNGTGLFVLTLLVLCGLWVWHFSTKQTQLPEKPHRGWGLLFGFLLALAPLTPFLIITNPWFCVRNAVTSFAGAALIVDLLVGWIFCRVPKGQVVTSCLAGVLAFVCCIAGVSELHDYRATYQQDQKVGSAIVDILDEVESTDSVGILNLESTYLSDVNYMFHEHITGCTSSGWALTGMAHSLVDEREFPYVCPLSTVTYLYAPYNKATQNLDTFTRLYYYDPENNTLLPVIKEKTGEGTYLLSFEDGSLCGLVYEEDDYGYFSPAT